MGQAPQSVAVIGLGYVGLPLATAFGRVIRTIGFDINKSRVEELRRGIDRNGEVEKEALERSLLSFTTDISDLVQADVFVVAVPTPVDEANRPDLAPLVGASRTVGAALKERASGSARRSVPIVVYESTVYPGCTEEDCVPVIEASSGLQFGSGFHVGYSPERINPGDNEHTVDRIVKVVSASDPGSLDVLASLYARVTKAGVYRAPTIRTAEAAKVIENTQRDLNIALMNELSILFHKLGLDTQEVLKAAGTKWNFLPFRPGLVGGHCIPVDPYYLTHKAEEVGYHPQVILAGRRINETMASFVGQEAVRQLVQTGAELRGASAIILGVTFKENVPDMRSSKVADVASELRSFGVQVYGHDPLVGAAGVRKLGLSPIDDPWTSSQKYEIVVLAVSHAQYQAKGTDSILRLLRDPSRGVISDVKGVLDPEAIRSSGARYWRL